MPLLKLSFASGESSLEVRYFTVHEAVSTPYSVSIWVRSRDPSVDLEAIAGKSAVFEVVTGYVNTLFAGARVWTGVVSFIEQAQGESTEVGLSTYYLRIVPRLWLLTQQVNHRIFQHLSIPDIVDLLLDGFEVERTWRIDRGSYPKLEYKVQYGETDYAFFSRLIEEAGIAYTFDDADGKASKLVLGDALHEGPRRSGPPIPYVDNPNQAAEKEFVTEVHLAHEVRPGAHVIRDHDFRNPAFPLFGEAPSTGSVEARYEQYHYQPGAFLIEGAGGGTPVADEHGVARHQQPFGVRLAEAALLGERMGKRGLTFAANVIDLRPGAVFSIDRHGHPEVGAPLLVTAFTIDGSHGEEWGMAGHAVFVDTAYRPLRATPRPQVHGIQSAVVVGPPGEEIYPDEFGRVRVQFPWDRDGKLDDFSSCWLRVNQGWGGKGYGMIAIPRIGQEVLVAFLEGDPDRPVVAGRLYNVTNPVPYQLPHHKTVSTWLSHTSPDGEGSNEVKMEDLKGEELLYFRAQRNQRTLVKHDETITVLNDRDKHVADNETDTTGINRTEVTGVNRVEMSWSNKLTFIVGNRAKLIQGDETERTDGCRLLKVGKDLHSIVKRRKRELDQGDVHLHVKGKRSERIDGTQSLTLLVDQLEVVEGSSALHAGQEIHFASMSELVGQAQDITFKGPGGFIRINSGGVTISGTVVEINVGGSSGQGRGSKPELPELPNEAKVDIPQAPSAKVEQIFLTNQSNETKNKKGAADRLFGPANLQGTPLSRIYTALPSAAQLATDPLVDHAMLQAWHDSRPEASDVPRGAPGSLKQAQGGWIVWDTNSGQVSTIRVATGTRDGLGTIAGTRPDESDNRKVVGWFQTKPNKASEGYTSDPGPADRSWQQSYAKCPGLVQTHDGRKIIPYP